MEKEEIKNLSGQVTVANAEGEIAYNLNQFDTVRFALERDKLKDLRFKNIVGSVKCRVDALGNKDVLDKYKTENFGIDVSYTTDGDELSVKGLIVPHHLTASALIHEAFWNVVGSDVKTVVLIGPDHESVDKGKIFTSLKGWRMPFGILETDGEIVRKLTDASIAVVNDDKLMMEHSVAIIIPFVKYYLPNVQIVPIVLTKQVKEASLDDLADLLAAYAAKNNVLFVASIDFSHYLRLEDAKKADQVTMKAIAERDTDSIMKFTNDNLDSPPSAVLMLKLADLIGTDDIHMLNHSNSELILQMEIEETTSYMTYLFCE